MSEDTGTTPPLRDVKDSEFSKILASMENECVGFIAAIFYDELGETIDYYSYLDPFDTRLVGAHHGLFVSSVNGRTVWMNLGTVGFIELYTTKWDSLTVSIGDNLFLTVLVKLGKLTPDLHKLTNAVIEQLRIEIGI